jgi:hypothetical protein
MSEKTATSDRLASALVEAGAPADMVIRARGGYYDDFKSPLGAPIMQLANDAAKHGLRDMARRARSGEFDSQDWEAEAWMRSAEAQEAVKHLRGGT